MTTSTVSLQLHRNAHGRLVLTAPDGTAHEGVTPVRAFPIMLPRVGAHEAKQVSYRTLHFLGIALAFSNEMNPAIAVQQVERWPGPISPGLPRLERIVLGNGIADAQFAHRGLDIGADVLEAELGSMDADYLQALRAVLRIPAVHVRQGSPPVDAGVGAELDQHHLPT